ncbi:MarR family winged helix-turn-helix transcriptional regulator [Desulfovibrio inopinatus]|uniref:MarR family winged helix-turn-helix transcriptional regulator n=1 Tax=Desulfovibrio inopinatus TaxID=102109 RepID=UPI0004101F15|nr:MarR family transcriptional regulator [Desulfovibrio inopinatus]
MSNYGSPVIPDNATLIEQFQNVSRYMARAFHRRDHAHHAQGRVLSIIREQGPINQGDLLEMLDVRSSSLSEVLAKLERHGFISRERDETDKRRFIISATPQAAIPGQTEDDVTPASLFNGLDDEERRQLGAILEKLVTSLKNNCDAEGPSCRGRGRGRGHRDHPRRGGGKGFRKGKP